MVCYAPPLGYPNVTIPKGAQLEHESHPHHHPHRTGVRWLDLTLGIAATIVSLVSLWLGLHSAHSMEKLVTANSYPYLELERSNMVQAQPGSERFQGKVEYMLLNNGVGPARIEWVELKFKGTPVRDLNALFDACCKDWHHHVDGIDMRGGIDGNLVRPGVPLPMFSWVEPSSPNPVFAALYRQMDDISYAACYCSVFDECYVRTDQNDRPRPVAQCSAPAVPFRPGFRKG